MNHTEVCIKLHTMHAPYTSTRSQLLWAWHYAVFPLIYTLWIRLDVTVYVFVWPGHHRMCVISKLNVRFYFINRTPRIFLMPALRWSDTTLHQLIIIIAPACIHNTWIWWWWNVSVWKTAEVHFCTWLSTWMMQLSVAKCMCLRQGPHLLLLHPLSCDLHPCRQQPLGTSEYIVRISYYIQKMMCKGFHFAASLQKQTARLVPPSLSRHMRPQ